MINMQIITIEQYLDKLKITYDQLIKEVEDNPITTDKLKSLFIEKRTEMGVEREKFEDVLTDIELLFDKVPDEEYNALFVNYFNEVSKLNGHGFESWLNDITFNGQIEDDIKISYLCHLYDFELTPWFSNAIQNCPTNPKQEIMVYLQNYQNMVEGFYSNILNILIYAMIKTSISGTLVLEYPNGKRKNLKNYKNVSKLDLFGKLLVLQSDSIYKELRGIAEVCNKDLRNAVAHHSYKLNQTEQKIEFKSGQLSFDDFIKIALELTDYRVIIAECFNYYSMKCFFESKGILTA
jgi:hypothetical protein